MGIKIERLDELKRKLEEAQEGLTLPILQQWANKIEVEAKYLASGELKHKNICESRRI